MPVPTYYEAGTTGITAANLNKTGDANFLVHQQESPNMTVYIESGVAQINGITVKYAGGNSGTITAPVSNNRIDLVCVDSAGAISITTGTAAASPSAPSYPTDKLVIAELYIPSTATSIKQSTDGTNGYVYRDSRTLINGTTNYITECVAGEAMTGATTPQPVFCSDGNYVKDRTSQLTDDSDPDIEANIWSAQTITTPSNANFIVGVDLKLFKQTGMPDVTMTIGLYATSAGKPTGAAIATITASTSTIATSATVYSYLFSSPVACSPSTMYAITVSIPSTGGYKLNWRVKASSNPYADGTFVYTTDGGTNWTINANDDCYFVLYTAAENLELGKWYQSDADNPNRQRCDGVTPTTASASQNIIVARDTIKTFTGLTAGSWYKLSNTQGAITVASTSTSNEELIGFAKSTTELVFKKKPFYLGTASSTSSVTAPLLTNKATAYFQLDDDGNESLKGTIDLYKNAGLTTAIARYWNGSYTEGISFTWDTATNIITIAAAGTESGLSVNSCVFYFFDE